MAVKKKKTKRSTSTGSKNAYQRFIASETRGISSRIKKAESSLKSLKKEKAKKTTEARKKWAKKKK